MYLTRCPTAQVELGDVDVVVALTEGLVLKIAQGSDMRLLGTYVASPLCWAVSAAGPKSVGFYLLCILSFLVSLLISVTKRVATLAHAHAVALRYSFYLARAVTAARWQDQEPRRSRGRSVWSFSAHVWVASHGYCACNRARVGPCETELSYPRRYVLHTSCLSTWVRSGGSN